MRVLAFFPLSEYVSGRTSIALTVNNLPSTLAPSEATLDFAGGGNVSCTSVDHTLGVLTFTIPSSPSPLASSVAVRPLHPKP